MAHIQSGTVAPPVRLLKATPRLVLDAQLASAGPFRRIFVKVVPVHERCIEVVCAWIGREVGLPVPEPCLPLLPRARLPKHCAWPFGDATEQVVFATIAIEQAQQLIRIEGKAVIKLLDNWPHLPMAAAFDHLIANDDRTEGNILLGPRQELWLIDHSRSLGGGGNQLFSSEINPLFTNFFLERLASFSVDRRLRLRADVVGACSRLDSAVARVPYDLLGVPIEIAEQMNSFLRARLRNLRPMLFATIGLPELPGSISDLRGEH